MTHSSRVSRSGTTLRWLAALSLGTSAFLAPSAHAALDPKAVDAAVDKGVAFLLSQQQKDGSFEPDPKVKDHSLGGETAIATYALLAAGQKFDSPAIKKAIEWLEHNDLHGTYAVGLRSQFYQFIPDQVRNKDKNWLPGREHDRDFMLFSRIQRGTNIGFYGYSYGTVNNGSLAATMAPLDPKGPLEGAWFDRSNSQYGVLGAWALEQAGAEIPIAYWQEEDTAWKKAQLTDGGWNYNQAGENNAATSTMTAAGIATLFITQDYLMRANIHQFETCHGGIKNDNIERGLAWMDKHIQQALVGGGGWAYYGMYGIERIGVASGRKYFGTVDWYQKGAANIVAGQAANGAWGAVHDTCFGVLFLVRGRAPVMMNKLMYASANKKQNDPWNERPRDAANLAHWMGKRSLEGYMNWQIVNLQVPVEELHDSPILYISGSEELLLSNQDVEKLRVFVEQGGMILGNADCGSKTFASSFQKLGNKLFPKYEFRRLPANHPIYSEQYIAAKWKSHPVVEGLSNNVRELMLLIPDADPAHAWQTDSTETRKESYQLAGNIFLYATGKENLEHKGATYIVTAEGQAGREMKVARVEAGENWNPEPGGWPRVSAILHNDKHLDVKTTPVKLGSNLLAAYKIAHLTGTTRLILSAAQRQEIKDFVTNGGTLLVDAAGGNTDFADSAEAELKQIFGAEAAKGLATPLPPTHAVFDQPDSKITKVVYRSYARRLLTGSLHDPRLRAITVAGRVGVLFSREDLSAGMVGEAVDGIVGYEPKFATQLMCNMLTYAEKGGSSATADAKGEEK